MLRHYGSHPIVFSVKHSAACTTLVFLLACETSGNLNAASCFHFLAVSHSDSLIFSFWTVKRRQEKAVPVVVGTVPGLLKNGDAVDDIVSTRYKVSRELFDERYEYRRCLLSCYVWFI